MPANACYTTDGAFLAAVEEAAVLFTPPKPVLKLGRLKVLDLNGAQDEFVLAAPACLR